MRKGLENMQAKPVTGAGLREEFAAMRNMGRKISTGKNAVLGALRATAAKTREITQDPAKLLALATGVHVLMPKGSGRPRRKKR